MAKKNQLTKSDYLPMEEYKKLLRLLHKVGNIYGNYMLDWHSALHYEYQMYCL